MKLHKYNQFLGEKPLNENLDKAKKFLKLFTMLEEKRISNIIHLLNITDIDL